MGFHIPKLKIEDAASKIYSEGLAYSAANGKKLVEFGVLNSKTQKSFGIENTVYFADFLIDNMILESKNNKVTFAELPKYPEVRRDLALLLDKSVKFGTLKDIAFRTEKSLLRSVGLFDVYEGKGIPEDKKSYAISFILRDNERTLNDIQIDKIRN